MATHRSYDPEFKVRVVLEALKGEKSQAQICREYGVAEDLVSRWRQAVLERAPDLFRGQQQQSEEQKRIADLERLVGQLTMESSFSKKSLQSAAHTPEKRRELVRMLAADFP
jgi:transposase